VMSPSTAPAETLRPCSWWVATWRAWWTNLELGDELLGDARGADGQGEVGEAGGIGGDAEMEAGCEAGSPQWQGIIEEEEGTQASRLWGTKSAAAWPGGVDPSPTELPLPPTSRHPYRTPALRPGNPIPSSGTEKENETTMLAILGFIPATKSF
jgi:hypothetical protein